MAQESPANLQYTLQPANYMNRFSDSQSYLIQELNDLLYGSAYQLLATDGQIIIRKTLR
jgi:hypothetical protein